jgi:GxxExxY protein
MELIHKETTEIILASFYNVYNTLGYGFLEKVYENALFLELTEAGLICEKQKPIEVFYKGVKAGNYFADIIVNNEVIIKLKAAEGIAEEHEYQLLNYLKSTEVEIGLLLNFGKKLQFKRKIYRNKSVLNQ